MKEQPKKRGGPRPGSGRPTKDEADKVVKCKVSMTNAHHEATEGDRSGMIRRALDLYLGYDFDYFLFGKVLGGDVNVSESGVLTGVRIEFYGGAKCQIHRPDSCPAFTVGDFLIVSMKRGVQEVRKLNPPSGDKTKNNFNNTQSEMSEGVVVGSMDKNPDVLKG